MTRVIPSGKHKGRAINSLEDAELQGVWAGWNGSPNLKKTEFFRVIVSEIEARTGRNYSARTTVVETGHRSMFADDGPVVGDIVEPYRMTFGKHKGELITLVPMNYLRWCSENITSGSVARLIIDEINRRGGCSVPSSTKNVEVVHRVKEKPKPKKSKRHRTLDDSRTHYRWEDRNGFVHSIPQDVLMTGREEESCPFDVTDVVCGIEEQFGELDLEFREMFR
jgi:uncharacterized protein (DUF3820 family)